MNAETKHSGPVDVIAILRKASRSVPNEDFVAFDDAISAVVALIEAHKDSVAEVIRIRDAAMVVCCAVENGTDVTKHADALLSELDKPWSVDRSQKALAAIGNVQCPDCGGVGRGGSNTTDGGKHDDCCRCSGTGVGSAS